MGQLSFFSADLAEPLVADLGGVLAAHGQLTGSPSAARVSILVDDPARAAALQAECAARGIAAEVSPVVDPDGSYLLRTARTSELLDLGRAWTRGAVKSVPDGLSMSAGFLRLWVIAAGRMDETGYLLGVDPHAPDTVDSLIAGCARAGVAGSYIGSRAGGPGIRIVGHRRLARLIDTVGTLPADLPPESYPVER